MISAPNAHTITASGRAAAIRARASSSLTDCGLVELDAELAGGVGDRRRGQSPATSARTIRPGDDELRAVRRIGEPPQHGGGELRGAEIDGSHRRRDPFGPTRARQAGSASRSAFIASLRCEREIRSSTSTPSRWSTSCWITRASRPEASIEIGSPNSLSALTRT